MIKNVILTAAFGLLLSVAASADTATIEFLGTTGVSDGTDFVLPYEVSINGVDQFVTCYDNLDVVSDGQIWQANLLTLSQAAANGYFSNDANPTAGYERIAWLDTQTYSDQDQEIGLQYAIWSVFGNAPAATGTVLTDELAYEAAADAAATGGYSGFDFSSFVFIEEDGGVPGAQGTEQAFVYSTSSSFPVGGVDPAVPEPGGFALAGIGTILFVVRRSLAKS
jgi:hypothetical protein